MKNFIFTIQRPSGAVFGAISAILGAYKGGGGRCLTPCISPLNSPFAARFSR